MESESNIENPSGTNAEPISNTPVNESERTFTAVPSCPQNPIPAPAKPKTSGWRIFLNILLVFSIITNAILFLMLLCVGIAFVAGESLFTVKAVSSKSEFQEKILVDGSSSKKIAVINLYGVIQEEVSEEVRLQLKAAAEDDSVKGVILRISSPGGTVSASDQIHYYVSNLRKDTGKPVVAFMQSIAASGGYYSAVACEHIVAEPTVITGSIGVIMNHLVVKDLLELKLGIQPEVLKSGPRKDWPSMFSPMTEEQKQYLDQKLISPAYERFVELVSEGRKHALTPEQVRLLADGSIYPAEEALQKGLIDEVGYFEAAVDTTEKLADISGARVIEYRRPLSWLSSLGAENRLPSFDTKMIEKLLTPQLMYLWDGKK